MQFLPEVFFATEGKIVVNCSADEENVGGSEVEEQADLRAERHGGSQGVERSQGDADCAEATVCGPAGSHSKVVAAA